MLMQVSKFGKRAALIGGVVAAALAVAPASAKDKIKVGVVSFLSGPAAGPFGVPGRNGAELMIDAINAGKVPAPYNTPGFAGAKLEPVIIDESGGGTKQVAEYRNLVEKQKVDAVVGYISSGSCLAIAPVAEELKKLTVAVTCGTPRLFEGNSWKYTFRTQANAVGDSIAAARYVTENFKDINGFTGINQNYAWGQDSWKFFRLAMKALAKDVPASENPQFPKIFAGQYGTELSTLALDKAKFVHSSFWDGDIEAFILQGLVRGFFKDKQFISVVGASAVDSLGKKFPEGTVLGTRGESGILVRDDKTKGELNTWFATEYEKRYGAPALGPSYQYAQGVLFLKIGMDKAAKAAGGFPTQDQIISAMEGITFQSIAGEVSMSQGKGHQAVHPVGYGITSWNSEKNVPEVKNVKFYGPSCIYPPEGTMSADWLEAGMPGAKC